MTKGEQNPPSGVAVPTEKLVGRSWLVILTEASVSRLVATPNSNRG